LYNWDASVFYTLPNLTTQNVASNIIAPVVQYELILLLIHCSDVMVGHAKKMSGA